MKTRKPETVKVGGSVVKIYRRQKLHKASGTRYRVFEVADYTGGERRLQSFSDHDEARAEAKRIANRLSTGNAEAALMRGSEAASYGRAVDLLRPTGIALEVAAATFAKAFEILGGDQIIEAA